MNQNDLEMKNWLKNERGKKKITKNTSQITRTKLLPNPRGHKEDLGPSFTLEFLVFTLNTWISGPLSHTINKKGGTVTKDERKNGGGEGDGGSLILFNRAITQS
jgi:hypothetical protein